MKILISSIGSRGDTQPSIALGLELQALGHTAVLCVPPNYQAWVESYGLCCIPVGRDLGTAVAETTAQQPQNNRRMALVIFRAIRDEIDGYFRTLMSVAADCDVIVGGVLQAVGPSVAEALKIPYVHAAYGPHVVPSADYPPPSFRAQHLPGLVNRVLWKASDWVWNIFRDAINQQREQLGLKSISNVSRYLLSNRVCIASDPLLAPALVNTNLIQTGSWLLPDSAPLPDNLEEFLEAGKPPIYFGFGSTPLTDPGRTSRTLIEAARAVGYRAIISRGWGNLDLIDGGSDCLRIADVNFDKLFPRVAAIVHHGGAGTVTAAAMAGKPQIIVPHGFDQHYWADRVTRLGIGVGTVEVDRLRTDQLSNALRRCLNADISSTAKTVAPRIELRGAHIAAKYLSSL